MLLALVLLDCVGIVGGSAKGADGASEVERDGGTDAEVERDAGNVGSTDAGQTPAAHDAGLPAWLQGAPLLEWVAIPGTRTGVSNGIDAYSGWAFREDTSELYSVASGGHGDSANNGVYSIRLTDAAPAWVMRTAPSPNPTIDVAYYPDGKPSARHVYHHNHWVPQLNRVMLFGAIYTYGSAFAFGTVDGWNPDTNAYDPAGTYPNLPTTYDSVIAVIPALGEGWRRSSGRWRANIGYDNPIVSIPPQGGSAPMCYDSIQDQLFSMRFGNGQDSNPERGLTASVIRRRDMSMSTITFNPSPALTQLIADQPAYNGLCFDPLNDCYYFYDGRSSNATGSVPGGPGRVFRIVPNAGNTWDISMFDTTSTSGKVPATTISGIHSRFSYVPALKGVVMMPSRDAGLYFMRTAL